MYAPDGSAMQVTQETWVRSLGWEDPLEKGKAVLENSIDRRAWRATVHGERVKHD